MNKRRLTYKHLKPAHVDESIVKKYDGNIYYNASIYDVSNIYNNVMKLNQYPVTKLQFNNSDYLIVYSLYDNRNNNYALDGSNFYILAISWNDRKYPYTIYDKIHTNIFLHEEHNIREVFYG